MRLSSREKKNNRNRPLRRMVGAVLRLYRSPADRVRSKGLVENEKVRTRRHGRTCSGDARLLGGGATGCAPWMRDAHRVSTIREYVSCPQIFECPQIFAGVRQIRPDERYRQASMGVRGRSYRNPQRKQGSSDANQGRILTRHVILASPPHDAQEQKDMCNNLQ